MIYAHNHQACCLLNLFKSNLSDGLSTSSWNDLTTHSAECWYSKLSDFHAISWKLGLIAAQDASMSTTIQCHGFHFPWGVSGIPLLYNFKGKERKGIPVNWGLNHVGWPKSLFVATTLCRLPVVICSFCSVVGAKILQVVKSVHKGAVPLSWNRLCKDLSTEQGL